MFFQVRLFRGLFSPYVAAHQLHKAEQIHGIWTRTSMILAISLILAGISAFFGIGNESLSKQIYDVSAAEFENMKALFAVGQVVLSVLITTALIFCTALVFWVFTDIEYSKLVVIGLLTAAISLLEKAILIPFQLFFGLDEASSPFGLGVVAQYVTELEFLIQLLGNISIFSIWMMVLQYLYLKWTTEKKNGVLLLIVLSTNLFIWIFSALFSYIKFEVML